MSQNSEGSSEPRRDGFSPGQLLMALLGGAAAGAAVAYLTAPRSGADSRARLREIAERSRDKLRHVPEALSEASEAAQSAFSAAMANGHDH